MCVREINFAAFRIRRVAAAHNFPEQIINPVENWRIRGLLGEGEDPNASCPSKRRFYDRGDDDDREKWRVKSDRSLSLGIRLERKAGERDFSPFFFFGARGLRERKGERERKGKGGRGERAMTERLIKRSYYFDANILISGEISRYRPVITTRRSDINNGFILIT